MRHPSSVSSNRNSIIRSTLNEIYFGNTHHIVNGLRSVEPLSDGKQQAELQKDLMSALARKNAASAKAE